MTLLEEITAFDNLYVSFKECARGKRQSQGYQNMLVNLSDELIAIRDELLTNGYRWGPYRCFMVYDPKARRISAPSFRDRVVHTAVCRIIEPILDAQLTDSVYACRRGLGSRNAAIDLIIALKRFGCNRFVIKLDIEKYFDSIDHHILLERVNTVLPDRSISVLLQSLLVSYAENKGLPIGSLCSQMFANFYLASADQIVIENLNGKGFYFRYMDDFVIGSSDKGLVWQTVYKIVQHVENTLNLSLPFHKRIPLGNDPVPFLGFVLDFDGYRILSRNRKRHEKRIQRMEKQMARESSKEEVRLSFAAWRNLEPHLSDRLAI